jgi:hypothetical protein
MAGMTSESLARDNLLLDDLNEFTDQYTIVSGAGVLVRGTLLGLITASGKLKTSLTAAGDGSNSAFAILAEDVDATSADKTASVYLAGSFNQAAITLGTGWTIATAKAALRSLGIFIKAIAA